MHALEGLQLTDLVQIIQVGGHVHAEDLLLHLRLARCPVEARVPVALSDVLLHPHFEVLVLRGFLGQHLRLYDLLSGYVESVVEAPLDHDAAWLARRRLKMRLEKSMLDHFDLASFRLKRHGILD